MTKSQVSHYNAAYRILAFFLLNNTALSAIETFAAAKLIFQGHMTTFEEAILKQAIDISMYSGEKKVYKNIMSTAVDTIMSKGFVQATVLQMPDLADQLNHPKSYVSLAADKLAISRATDIRNILNENLTDLTEVTEDDIAELDLKISKFNQVHDLPTSKIKTRKSVGTEPIPKVILLIVKDKKLFTKMINSYLPALNTAWANASKIGESTGARHLSMYYLITDSITGIPIPKVNYTLTNGTETFQGKTSKKGILRKYSLEMGTYDLTVDHPAYHSASKSNIPLTDKTTARFTIKLVKIVPPPIVPNPPLPNT